MPLYPVFYKACLVLLCVILLAMAGLSKLSTNASYLAYFDPRDPLVNNHLTKKQQFLLDESLVLILEAKEAQLWQGNPLFYRQSKRLVKQLNGLKEINFSRNFLAELRWRNNIFASEKNKPRAQLLSADGTTAMIILDVSLHDKTAAKEILALNKAISTIAHNSYTSKNIRFYISGTLGLNHAYIETVRHDIMLFIPFLLTVMFATLCFIFRSAKIASSMIAIGLFSTLSAFGVSGWLGYSLSSINIFTPIMIIGLSIVTSMHNVVAYYQYISQHFKPMQALQRSFKDNLIPLTLSCVTTALGFLFLLNSPSPPIVVTGVTSALGVLFSLAITLTLFQVLLLKAAPTKSIATKLKLPSLIFFSQLKANFSKGLPGPLLKVMPILLILTVISAAGLSQLKINDNVYRYFPDDYPFRQSIALIDKQFSGALSIDYLLRAPTTDTTSTAESKFSPEILSQMRQFIESLQQIEQITEVRPAASLLQTAYLEQFFIAADTSKSILNTYIDKTTHSLRVEVRFKEMSSQEVLAINRTIQALREQTPYTLHISEGTSPDLLFAHLSYNNAVSMFSSLLLALSIISAVLGILLRSIKLCLLVLICNFLPVVIAYGFLGLSGGYLTLGSTVVMGMIIGIIVDDTLHLLFKYRQYHRLSDKCNALILMKNRVFPAVIYSSLTIILALAIGLVSDFKPTFEISLFSIFIIFVALVTDVLLLPALLNHSFFSSVLTTQQSPPNTGHSPQPLGKNSAAPIIEQNQPLSDTHSAKKRDKS